MVTSPRCIPNQTSNVHNIRQFVAPSCHCPTSVKSNKILLTYSEPSLNEEQERYVEAELSSCLSSSAKHNYGCVSQFKFMIPSYVVTNHSTHLTNVSHNRTAFNIQSNGFPLPYFFQRNSFVFNTIIIIFPSRKLLHTNVPSLRSRSLPMIYWMRKSVDKIIQQSLQMNGKCRCAARCNGADMRRPKHLEGKRLCPPQIPYFGEKCGLHRFIPKCWYLSTDLNAPLPAILIFTTARTSNIKFD